ncbi:ethanolamine permease [Cellulomonas marina]|uniref:Ethanolamine permease n=1 Tax=Cellulomonas marina TaxID=988821 RepID=A0A1I1AGR0_9CELL|nr:ethanolamine permease [Cellulomonas marina]GIG30187.1 ethanolamine permease [Cellulomonas marina]SFB37184.1 ethanolamine permease [Cellulomonas marina]
MSAVLDRPAGGSSSGDSPAGDDYFAQRSLRKGAAGWLLLAGLGISFVISGDFSGWNLGLAVGGWGGMLVAFVLMGVMYTCLCLGLAEMSSSLPTAGAGYGFARRALGRLGGYVTGVAILVEYVLAPAAIAVFIGGYVESLGLFGLTSSWPVYLACFALFIGIHLVGVGEALKAMFAITAVALLALLVFGAGAIGAFDPDNLFDIVPDEAAAGSSAFLPFGWAGALGALVFGIWFFLAIEGVPLAAEEANDPAKDMPRAILGAMGVLTFTGLLVLVLVPGIGGAEAMGSSGSPLPDALNAAGSPALATVLNYVGLAGLVASFFSIVYAYSRQLFALSRAGYLPRWMSRTSSRKTPVWALLVPGAIGFVLAAVIDNGDQLINIAVFGAAVSYVLLNLSHIVLRIREPELPRAYRAPGGVVTTGIGLVLSLVAVAATFVVDPLAAGITAGVMVAFVAFYLLWSRHHLVANAPEEEFAMLAGAEAELR